MQYSTSVSCITFNSSYIFLEVGQQLIFFRSHCIKNLYQIIITFSRLLILHHKVNRAESASHTKKFASVSFWFFYFYAFFTPKFWTYLFGCIFCVFIFEHLFYINFWLPYFKAFFHISFWLIYFEASFPSLFSDICFSLSRTWRISWDVKKTICTWITWI